MHNLLVSQRKVWLQYYNQQFELAQMSTNNNIQSHDQEGEFFEEIDQSISYYEQISYSVIA